MRNILVLLTLLLSLEAASQSKTIVYFDPGKSVLLPRSVKVLDSLAVQIKKLKRYRITINGYCDSTGIHPDNITLGFHRASSVFDHLNSHGIDGDSMIRNGFAESNPVAPGRDRRSLAKNRRVEILVSTSFNPPNIPETVKRFDASMSIDDLRVGQQLVLKNLNFVNNETTLLEESLPTLKALLKIMLDNPTLEIKLNGHVCCTSDMELSVGRAKYIYDYLVSNGIDPERMTYQGFSNRQPLALHDEIDTAAAHVNRRVEITIVKK